MNQRLRMRGDALRDGLEAQRAEKARLLTSHETKLAALYKERKAQGAELAALRAENADLRAALDPLTDRPSPAQLARLRADNAALNADNTALRKRAAASIDDYARLLMKRYPPWDEGDSADGDNDALRGEIAKMAAQISWLRADIDFAAVQARDNDALATHVVNVSLRAETARLGIQDTPVEVLHQKEAALRIQNEELHTKLAIHDGNQLLSAGQDSLLDIVDKNEWAVVELNH